MMSVSSHHLGMVQVGLFRMASPLGSTDLPSQPHLREKDNWLQEGGEETGTSLMENKVHIASQ